MAKTGRPPLEKHPAIAEHIKAIRASWEMTRKDFAAEIGIGVTCAADYEHGKYEPPAWKCQHLAKIAVTPRASEFWWKLAELRAPSGTVRDDAQGAGCCVTA